MNFLDDLDQLNKNQDDGFRGTNDQVYNEHNYILSPDKNPEFFYGLQNMLKDHDAKFYIYNKNGFTQEDLNQITYINSELLYSSYFKDVISLNELQYFHNLRKIYSFSFINCKKLKSIIFPENLKNIEFNSFKFCKSLKEIVFQKNIPYIERFGFSYCYSLEKIVIPKKFKDNIKNIFPDSNFDIDLSKVNITYI